MLSFYGSPLCPFSRMVQLTMELLGPYAVEYKFIKMNLTKGEQKEDWFLKINPKGGVPVIQEGEFCLAESNDIMKYLCSKTTETSLYPTDTAIRAKIDEALTRVSEIKFKCFVSKLTDDTDVVPDDAIREFEDSLTTFMMPYKKNADATGYLFGEAITIADIALMMRLTMCRMACYKWDKYPNVQKFIDATDNLAAFKKVNHLVNKVIESGNGDIASVGGF